MRPLFLLVFIYFSMIGRGQEITCPAQELTSQYLAVHGDAADLHIAMGPMRAQQRVGGGQDTVTVVFHVVWNTIAENVPDATLLQALNSLNEDFSMSNGDLSNVRPPFSSITADVGVHFCLAVADPNGASTTGITRTQTTETWFDPSTEADDMKSPPKGISAWDPDHYLNIWVCDISSGATGGTAVAGYAYLPVGGVPGSAVDGIVLDHDLGTGPGARTLSHEAGHYFGLLHPWGITGGCGDDDGHNDTPNTDTPTYTCSSPNLMKCGVLTQYENFMDYSVCGIMFTIEQSQAMNAVLNSARASLSGTGCDGSSAGPCIPGSLVGTSDGDFIDGVQLGNISNLGTGSVNGPAYTNYNNLFTAVQRGNSYDLSITSGDYFPDNYAAWIDFDQNGSFDATEKLGEFATSSSFETGTINFQVPANAPLGSTTMRVRGVHHDVGEPIPTDPCYAYTWGETEDYGILVDVSTGYMDIDQNDLIVTMTPVGLEVRKASVEGMIDIAIFDPVGRALGHFNVAGNITLIPNSKLPSGPFLVRIFAGKTRYARILSKIH